MKVGIIRCLQTEDMCPGTTDFKVIKDKSMAFEGIKEDIDIIGLLLVEDALGKRLFQEPMKWFGVVQIRLF